MSTLSSLPLCSMLNAPRGPRQVMKQPLAGTWPTLWQKEETYGRSPGALRASSWTELTFHWPREVAWPSVKLRQECIILLQGGATARRGTEYEFNPPWEHKLHNIFLREPALCDVGWSFYFSSPQPFHWVNGNCNTYPLFVTGPWRKLTMWLNMKLLDEWFLKHPRDKGHTFTIVGMYIAVYINSKDWWPVTNHVFPLSCWKGRQPGGWVGSVRQCP